MILADRHHFARVVPVIPMLPIESKSVQRVFFGIRRDYRGDVAEAGHPARAGYRGPPGTGGDAVS